MPVCDAVRVGVGEPERLGVPEPLAVCDRLCDRVCVGDSDWVALCDTLGVPDCVGLAVWLGVGP